MTPPHRPHPAHRPPSGARIASLVPSLTETLFDLGIGDRLVARTDYCVHPAQAQQIPTVGGPKSVDLDLLLSLRPTHALVDVEENPRALAEALTREGVELVVTHPTGPRDNLELFRTLGRTFGRSGEAERLCSLLEEALERLAAASAGWPERRVLYLIWKDPWMTVSPDTYSGRVLAAARLMTVVPGGGPPYPEIELTPELLSGVDEVLFASEPYCFERADLEQLRQQFPGAPRLERVDGEAICWFGSHAIGGLDQVRELGARLALPP